MLIMPLDKKAMVGIDLPKLLLLHKLWLKALCVIVSKF
nr:MAG TPA: hypothetical protein [Caudoviricetes sp.]